MMGAGCVPRLYSSDADAPARLWEAPSNRWPSAAPPADLVAAGFAPGQVPPDVRGVDQFGDEVSLWQFYGRPIVFDISTMWCAPCQDLAKGAEEINQHFAEDGLIYLTALLENEHREGPTVEELELWSRFPAFHSDPDHPYDRITGPIISDPLGQSGSARAVRNGQYPVALLINPDLTVERRVDPPTDAAIEAAIRRWLYD